MTLDHLLWATAVVAGIVGSWLITRHYYRRSVYAKRVPTFIVQSTFPVVVPGLSNIPGLSVALRGREIGKEGITQARIYFWNSGTLPILQSEILEPYTIS